MISRLKRAWSIVICVAVVLVTGTAWGEDRVDRLAEKLRGGDDFRVRTQAALALGATKTKRAVDPLCDGLKDENTTVRAAAAAALGKLRKGGVKCLESRLKSESSSSVKSVIKKSIKRINKALGPAIGPDTKVYIAVEISNETSLSDSFVESRIRKGLKSGFKKLDGYVMAPTGETPSEGKALLAKHKRVKALFLAPKVSMTHKGRTLKVKLSVAVFTYPGKALKGMFSVTVGYGDVSADDKAVQKELLREAAKSAVKKLSGNIDSFL